MVHRIVIYTALTYPKALHSALYGALHRADLHKGSTWCITAILTSTKAVHGALQLLTSTKAKQIFLS